MKVKDGILYVKNEDLVNGTVVIPKEAKEINRVSFFGCTDLTNITIPNSVEILSSGAFTRCYSLTTVEIPNEIKYINSYAFFNCPALKYNEYGNARYLGNKTNPYLVLRGTKSVEIETCTINPNTKFILDSAFQHCYKLKSITLRKGITTIPEYMFCMCVNIEHLTLPKGITTIEEHAFSGCHNLKSKKANYKGFYIIDGKLRSRDDPDRKYTYNFEESGSEICGDGVYYCTNLFELFNDYSGEIDKDIAIYEIEVGDKVVTSKTSDCWTNKYKLKKRLYREDVIRILNGGE